MTFRKAWKKFWESVLHLAIVQWLIAVLVALPIWLLYFTCRVRVINYDTFKKYRRAPAVFTFWHGRMLMLSPVICLGGMRSYVIASRHADGRMMARIQRLFGLEALYGSTTRGAAAVLRAGVAALGRGDHSICISPDGPSGPSMRMRMGALYFAAQSGAPIIPVCYTASRARFLRRWDRFLVPMPFSRIVVKVGEPIFIPKNLSDEELEKKRVYVENVMVALTRELDEMFNLTPVEQDLKSGEVRQQLREERATRRAARRAKRNGGKK